MNASANPLVIALGGNAISPHHAEDDIPHQFDTSRRTAERLADVIAAGHRVVITHGNGPQVGNVLRRVELAAHELYTLTLDVCVADTQAGMGYMIAQCLTNALRARGLSLTACTLVTAVEVAAADPAFGQPSKPIGRYYTPDRAAELRKQYGWQMVELPGRGFRRVVPSPRPLRIIEIDAIRALVAAGGPLITCGGGGIPVVRNESGALEGVEAVIDKDRTSALLAAELGATCFVIATGVERVALDFGTAAQRDVERMSVSEARHHLSEGQFPPGSMGPKIESAIEFLERARPDPAAARGARRSATAGPQVIICDLDHLSDALRGRSGTLIEL